MAIGGGAVLLVLGLFAAAVEPTPEPPEPIRQHLAMFALSFWLAYHTSFTVWNEGFAPKLRRRFEQPGRRDKPDF